MSDNQHEPPPRVTEFADGAGPRNPFGDSTAVAVAPTGGLVSVEQRKVMAEVQARILMARSMPRDPVRAADLIIQDCTRVTLAEKALYSYAKGGQDVSGPSIRLAEAVAQRWGNLASGIKELSRSNGYSECVAYAWDLESGYYDERQFQVRHWIDTRGGGRATRDEREIYELIANMGQRRKRAVILGVIPGDVIELAVQESERTLHAKADTSPEAIAKMVEAFDKIGVTKAQLEKRIQRRIEAIRPAQVVHLRKIYVSVLDEMSTVEEWFEATDDKGNGAWSGVEGAHAAQRPTVNPPAPRKAAAKKAAGPVQGEAKAETKEALQAALDRTASQKQATPPAEAKPPEEDGIPYDRWEPPGPGVVTGAPADGGSGDPPIVTAGPPPGEVVTNGSPGPAFEFWVLDEHGDPAFEAPESDPMAFAVALAALIRDNPGQTVNLMQQNMDGIDAARATRDIAVMNILASLEKQIIAPAENEPPAEEESDPTAAPVVELPMDRGKPAASLYIKAFKVAVGELSVDNWANFIDLNQSTMLRCEPSTCSLLLKALVERAKVIGATVPPDLAPSLLQRGKAAAPSPESTPAHIESKPAEDADWQTARNRLAELRECRNLPEFEAMGRGIVVKNFVERLDREGKTDIVAWLRGEAEKKRQELKGGV